MSENMRFIPDTSTGLVVVSAEIVHDGDETEIDVEVLPVVGWFDDGQGSAYAAVLDKEEGRVTTINGLTELHSNHCAKACAPRDVGETEAEMRDLVMFGFNYQKTLERKQRTG